MQVNHKCYLMDISDMQESQNIDKYHRLNKQKTINFPPDNDVTKLCQKYFVTFLNTSNMKK